MARSISVMFFTLLFAVSTLAKDVTFNWNFGWINANPDGRLVRPVIAINGQFPLPTINITLHDRIIIDVINDLGNTSATLHFHGIFQTGSTAQDGPYQVSQCGIPAGGSQTYNFTVDQPGTYFYHSHFEGQYPDGLRGALIVQDPTSPYIGKYDEEIVLTLSDWYHDSMSHLTSYYLNATIPTNDGSEPIPYSALMNDTQNLTLAVQPKKTYFLRVINFSCFAQVYLHFDQHSLTIIEVDGTYTHPKTVDSIYLAVAQRYGVLLTTKPTAAQNYAALGKLDETMFDGYGTDDYPSADVIPNVNSYLVYDQKKPLPAPLTLTLDQLNASVIDDFTLVRYDNMPLLQNPTQTFVFNLSFFTQDGQNRAGFNASTWLPQKVPSLFTAMTTGDGANQSLTYGLNANAMVLGYNGVIEVVINNFDNGSHPLHIHGHNVQLVARVSNATLFVDGPQIQKHKAPSAANPNPSIPAVNALGFTGDQSIMPVIPVRRDTWMITPLGYTVIRFVANNPGVWFFHCHMDWHNIAGLAATFIEAPLELQKTQTIPPTAIQLCQSQGILTAGNAAGNTQNYSDLTGANTVCPPLPVYVGTPPIQ